VHIKLALPDMIADLSRIEPWEEHTDCRSNSRWIQIPALTADVKARAQYREQNITSNFRTLIEPNSYPLLGR